jgi:putative DNA primase/helicase
MVFPYVSSVIDKMKNKKAATKLSTHKAINAIANLSKPMLTKTLVGEDPRLLTVDNGVIDLSNGKLYSHDSARLMVRACPVEYDPNINDPLWQDYLDKFQPDPELQGFLQRIAGYLLTGENSEERLFFFYGKTQTGKTTFLEAMKAIMGRYSATSAFGMFMKDHSGNELKHSLADLFGKRFVVSEEITHGQELAEGLVKQATGRSEVNCRGLYQKSFTYLPMWKIVISANERPKVDHDDDATWRRIIEVPFTHQLANPDPKVKSQFMIPRPGILTWAVKGAVEWYHNGLQVPEIINVANKDYRESMDPLEEFISECCYVGGDRKDKAVAMYAKYKDWAIDSRLKNKDILSRQEFRGVMTNRGYSLQDNTWIGISTRVEVPVDHD